MEAVQINLLQDRPQLDVEVDQYGRELLSSAALEKGKGKSSVTFTIISFLPGSAPFYSSSSFSTPAMVPMQEGDPWPARLLQLH